MIRAAIPTENGAVAGHFGRCPEYTVVEIEGDKVVSQTVVENPGHEPGRIPKFLHDRGVHVVVAGGMGSRASNLFNEMGIETILGAAGLIEDIVEGLRTNGLESTGAPCEEHRGGCH